VLLRRAVICQPLFIQAQLLSAQCLTTFNSGLSLSRSWCPVAAARFPGQPSVPNLYITASQHDTLRLPGRDEGLAMIGDRFHLKNCVGRGVRPF
jgi:hypothetical protein